MIKRKKFMLLSILSLVVLIIASNPIESKAEENCLQCHGSQRLSIEGSIHQFLSCTSCHTDITDFPHPPGASFSKKEIVITCTKCHKGIVQESYTESFHGKAVLLGSVKSATCTDCHGYHDILSSNNPASKVSKENTPETCANCHGLASPGFSQGDEHFKPAAAGAGAPMFYTAKFFIWLTLIVITALVIHIELQLFQNLRSILRERKKR
jgi:hypothetical protein